MKLAAALLLLASCATAPPKPEPPPAPWPPMSTCADGSVVRDADLCGEQPR